MMMAPALVTMRTPLYYAFMHGDSWLVFLAIFLFFALLVAPILAITAWVRVRRLEAQRQRSPLEEGAFLSRLYALEQKVTGLERAIADLATRPREAAPVPPAREATPAAPPMRPPAPPPAAPRTIAPEMTAPPAHPAAPPAPPRFAMTEPARARDESAWLDMETLIAGRWLNRIGITLVVLAVAYFLKYAFDNEWIGPTGQVTLGILFGAALLGFSQWLLQRAYTYFSEGIAGMGAAVLYLSLWAACNYYQPEVFSKDLAFFLMIAVTAAMLAIALGRDSQRIAVLALLGGYLTPMLVSTGRDAQVILFTYLLVLGAGLLAVARSKDWRWLELPSFALTQLYFWGWYDRFYRDEKLLITMLFATLFFVWFAALPVIRSRRFGELYPEQAVLVLLNAVWFFVALEAMLYRDHRWPLTFAILSLAAAHLVIVRLLPAPPPGEVPLVRLLFAGLALTFVTLVIPIRLEGKWITLAWAVEGAVLMWTGFRARIRHLRAAAFFLFFLVAFRLLAFPPPGGELFLNERFATYLGGIVCFGVALWLWQRQTDQVGAGEATWFKILGVAVNVLALTALTLELHGAFFPLGAYGDREASLKYQLSISLVWTAYAAGLLFLGTRWAAAGLRWQALILFGVVILKVFFSDLASLRGAYRILSFIVLGVVLLVISFLYQRRLAAQRAAEGP